MASVLSASAKGVTALIFVQVFSRALTFISNQATLRFLSPELLGASFQLELYSISILYFARESLRVTLQRQTGRTQAIVNVAYVPLLLGIPLTLGFDLIYERSGLPAVRHVQESLWLYGFAALIELLVEPAFSVVQEKLAYSIRASAETIATIARGVVTLGCVIWASKTGVEMGALPFAFGQLAYAAFLLLVYTVRTVPIANKDGFALTPRYMASTEQDSFHLSLFSKSICILSINMYLQNTVKFVLTQGDTFIIASMATLADQGTYALAANYGGLVARMLFQPIEESSRNLFSKLLSATQPPAASLLRTRTVLTEIMRAYGILALLAWAAGPTLAPQLLALVAGAKWADTDASAVLATYCYLIPLLALNGVSEAFVAAVASSADLRRQSAIMAGWSVGFAGAAFLFLCVLSLGAQGLVWANCVNMAFRIVWNVGFVRAYFARHAEQTFDWSACLPSLGAMGLSGLGAAFMRRDALLSTARTSSAFMKLLENTAVAAALMLGILVCERAYFRHVVRMLRSSSPDQKIS